MKNLMHKEKIEEVREPSYSPYREILVAISKDSVSYI
jgi:hypothetical protein